MSRCRLLALVLVSFSLSCLSAAVSLGGSFDMHFDKKPENIFYFSNPDEAHIGEYHPNAAGGIVFLPVTINEANKKLGYPSVQYVGITYKLEQHGILEVFCNSSSALDGDHRLLSEDNVPLDYKVEHFTDLATAKGTGSGTIFYDATSSVPVAKQPVYILDTTKAVDLKIPMETKKTEFLRMTVTANKVKGEYQLYSEGSYKGFISMKFTVN